jgi:hypothetical protein
MSSCEKCWRDSRWAARFFDGTGPDPYRKLVSERVGEDACTPEEQAGPDATECPACQRKTVHQHTHLCQTPGCALGEYKAES